MKASVQYIDFVGTCAADISDFQDLSEYLKSLGVDTNRYDPIGINFFTSNVSSKISFYVICTDEQGDKSKAVKIAIEDAEFQDVINLFKRFEVILTKKYSEDLELIDEPVKYIKLEKEK